MAFFKGFACCSPILFSKRTLELKQLSFTPLGLRKTPAGAAGSYLN